MGSDDGDDLALLRTEYAEIESLLSRSDPPEAPYESKYAARERLRSLLERAMERDNSALAVNLLARLGAVDHEVEELATSQEDLERALKMADGREADGSFVMSVLVCMNQLGILWCTRGDFKLSKVYLFRALDTYRAFKVKQGQGEAMDICDIHDLLKSPGEERSDAQKKNKNLDLLNTHTYYFLAQVG